jgi:hypothetical protein
MNPGIVNHARDVGHEMDKGGQIQRFGRVVDLGNHQLKQGRANATFNIGNAHVIDAVGMVCVGAWNGGTRSGSSSSVSIAVQSFLEARCEESSLRTVHVRSDKEKGNFEMAKY